MMKLKQMQGMGKIVAVLLGLAAGPLWAGTEGTESTFYGHNAGLVNGDDANENTFIGAGAGHDNTIGVENAFLGRHAGYSNVDGHYNTFLGYTAGYNNTNGTSNTFIGMQAGYSNTTGGYNTVLGVAAGFSNQTGSGNVFLGANAGLNETGSYKLYIDNGLSASPFIYGEFDNHLLKVNGVLNVRANGVAKSQMHFSRDDTDAGGFLTSVLDNNFFMSSGARYDSGNWVQRSADGRAVAAGSGSVGYRIFTSSGHAVGEAFDMSTSVRLFINYNGEFGINTAPVAGDEIHTSSGAHLTSGGVWTDASSREYKENVRPLTTEQAMQAVAQLVPVTYNYKVDSEEKHVGFIAEDVPELVATKDRRSLSPMDIVAALTKVVQEQKQTIEEQKTQLSSLLARMERLEQYNAHAAR
jgi:hypothetical protein